MIRVVSFNTQSGHNKREASWQTHIKPRLIIQTENITRAAADVETDSLPPWFAGADICIITLAQSALLLGLISDKNYLCSGVFFCGQILSLLLHVNIHHLVLLAASLSQSLEQYQRHYSFVLNIVNLCFQKIGHALFFQLFLW